MLTYENTIFLGDESSFKHCDEAGCTPSLCLPHKPTAPRRNDGGAVVFSYVLFNRKQVAAVGKEHRKLWVFFSTLKNTLSQKNWIHKSELRSLSEVLPYSYDTVRKYMEELCDGGYAYRTKRGYVLRSIKKVAADKFGVPSGFKYTYVVGATKKEITLRVSYIIMMNIKRSKVYSSHKQAGKAVTRHNKYQFLASGEASSLSVREVSAIMGFTSPYTGCKIEAGWESMKMVSIGRSASPLCHVSEYKHLVSYDKDLQGHCFIIGDTVMKRNMNVITGLV